MASVNVCVCVCVCVCVSEQTPFHSSSIPFYIEIVYRPYREALQSSTEIGVAQVCTAEVSIPYD